MNCQEFQEALPYMIESGGNEEEAGHLRSCPACAGLVQDLKYIADRAKLLLPMYEPGPRVWSNIEQALHCEGLLADGRNSNRGRNLITLPPQAKSWTRLG